MHLHTHTHPPTYRRYFRHKLFVMLVHVKKIVIVHIVLDFSSSELCTISAVLIPLGKTWLRHGILIMFLRFLETQCCDSVQPVLCYALLVGVITEITDVENGWRFMIFGDACVVLSYFNVSWLPLLHAYHSLKFFSVLLCIYEFN